MRRVLRKPKEMKIQDYFGCFIKLNKYLKEFPPFQASQELPKDKVQAPGVLVTSAKQKKQRQQKQKVLCLLRRNVQKSKVVRKPIQPNT